ncbi:hypothetical protein EVAR_55055_1 [Eumeta japonica]|uniref:Uncharacterized protein n=1 Tax=Eumeta variegata TaxID=151549 RepID=A0A4C1ZNB7_EUMVA|nr:hypothetical protein EVAR_55055_1 [Eumeta japonica]
MCAYSPASGRGPRQSAKPATSEALRAAEGRRTRTARAISARRSLGIVCKRVSITISINSRPDADRYRIKQPRT